MPRPHRNLLEGGLYHVHNRFSSAEEIFANPEGAARCVDLVRVAERRDGFSTARLRELVAVFGIARWDERAGECRRRGSGDGAQGRGRRTPDPAASRLPPAPEPEPHIATVHGPNSAANSLLIRAFRRDSHVDRS